MPGRFGSGGMPPLPLATGRWLLLGRRHENRARGFGERLQNRPRQNMWNKGNSGRPTGWPSMRCILHPRSASSDVNQPSGRTRLVSNHAHAYAQQTREGTVHRERRLYRVCVIGTDDPSRLESSTRVRLTRSWNTPPRTRTLLSSSARGARLHRTLLERFGLARP